MGNCQNFCQLGFTAEQSPSDENVHRHFLGRQVNLEKRKSPEENPNPRKLEQHFIRIKSTTWNKDSHSLFDYENHDSKKAIFKIRSSGSLVFARERVYFRRKNKCIENTSASNGINQEGASASIPAENELFRVRQEFGRFYLQQSLDADNRPTHQSNWVVIKSVQNQRKGGFQLLENDYIKLGRLKFKVREICESGKRAQSQIKKIIEEQTDFMSEQEPTEMLTLKSTRNFEEKGVPNSTSMLNNVLKTNQSNIMNLQGGSSAYLPQKDKSEDQQLTTGPETTACETFTPMCKICLSEQTDKDNPLVNPCKCTGSLKFVHIKCIQYWIRSKIQGPHQNSNCIVLLSKFFECELCKTKYHFKISSDGQIYDIVDYSKPEDGSPHLILEAFQGGKMQLIGVYILRLGGKNIFTIGRAHDADIRVSDISVSRQHAQLFYDQESHQLFLKDKDSKFGSLVLMRDDLEISSEIQSVQIQNGRTLVEFLPQTQPHGILSSCFGGTGDNDGVEIFSDIEDNQPNFETQTQDL